jgi:hypothetical protein
MSSPSVRACGSSLMIVDDFGTQRPILAPVETDSIPIVDADAELSPTIAGKCLKAVSRWDSKFLQIRYRIQLIESSRGNLPQLARTLLSGSLRVAPIENVPSAVILERSKHHSMISRRSCYVKPSVVEWEGQKKREITDFGLENERCPLYCPRMPFAGLG